MSSSDETKEQSEANCIHLLHAAGYYRARVETIPIFDRIVGGIVWLISKCSFEVDVDILYQENMSFRKKVPISEALSLALGQLQCPHTLAPHQIMGLDYDHLFPVVRWLVTNALKVDSNRDRFKSFTCWFTAFAGSQIEEAKHEFRFLVRSLNKSELVSRKYRRSKNMSPLELEDDVRCTVREYTQKSGSSNQENIDSDDDPDQELDPLENLNKLSLKRFQAILEEAHLSDGNRKKMEVIRMSINVSAQLEALAVKIEQSAMLYMKERQENEAITEKWNKVSETLSCVSAGDNARMNELMTSYSETKIKSKAFRKILFQELNELEESIRKARLNLDENGKPKKYSAASRDTIDLLEKVKEERRISARELSILQYALDQSLSNTIRTQYIQRELERASDTLEMNLKAKRALSHHNLALDILNVTTRVQLLNDQIDESLKDKLLDGKQYNFLLNILNDARTKLEDYHHKAQITQNKLDDEKKNVEKKRKIFTRKHRETQGRAEYLNKMVDVNDRLQMFKEALERLSKNRTTSKSSAET